MSAPDETANADDSTTPTETQPNDVIIADLEQQVADANDARLRALAERS